MRAHHNYSWDDADREDAALYDRPLTADQEAEADSAAADQRRADECWRLVHDEVGMAELIHETVNSEGGLESLSRCVAALMRAPEGECQAVAVADLRTELNRWAARIK